MIRLPLALFAVFLFAWGSTGTLATAKPVSHDDVQHAIATFEKDPASKEGLSAGESILAYAQQSKLPLSKDALPWMKDGDAADYDTRRLLLIAYIAGNLSSKGQDAVYNGWEQVLTTYAQLLQINPAAKISEVEDLKKKEANSELRAYAAKVQGK